MPTKTVHCSICGQAIKGYDFKERMDKLRKHRKKKHPKQHRQSYSKKQLDPEIQQRHRLVAVPRVLGFKDYNARGKIRILHRANSTLFPELALTAKLRGLAHELQDDMLKDAGFTEESNGKWVFRSNKFSVFLFV